MEEISLQEKIEKLPLGVACIDGLTNGGLEAGIITEIFGEGGSGKSNVCMLAACSALRLGKKVVFIDSEGFSSERFLSICKADNSKLKVIRVFSLDDQEVAITKFSKIIEKDASYGLFILDSFSEFFRLERTGDNQSRVIDFQRQLSLLSSIAAKRKIPVLITNQIYQDIANGDILPFGGYVVDHIMKAIYRLERLPDGRRKMTVMKHRSVKEGNSVEFRIVQDGISCEVKNGN
ncbi:DNA repair and recombination protein RadB [Thermoplasma volcanium]|nr:DNA repair and recombination protein RadB [Thermoplasma volcanium]